MTAEAIAEALEAGIARARQHRANVERSDELALRLAAHEAGVPMEHPVAALFLNQYSGPVDAYHLAAAWYRQVLDRRPPTDVTVSCSLAWTASSAWAARNSRTSVATSAARSLNATAGCPA